MKVVAEIVASIILLASGAYFVPKAVESFKKEALMKVNKGLSPLEHLTKELQK